MTVMYNLPNPMWALVLIAVGGISTATGVMLYRNAVASGLSRRTGVGLGGAGADRVGPPQLAGAQPADERPPGHPSGLIGRTVSHGDFLLSSVRAGSVPT
jgi:hypothetical protein